MIFNNDLAIALLRAALPRLVPSGRLDIAIRLVLGLLLLLLDHGIRDAHGHGDDPLALDVHLAVPAAVAPTPARAGGLVAPRALGGARGLCRSRF